MEDEAGGRFEDCVETHHMPSLLNFLLNNDFVGMHIKDNKYLVMPIEDISIPVERYYIN